MFSMFRKMICLVSFVLVLSLAGEVQAVQTWIGAPDSDWFTATNWDPTGVPTDVDHAKIGTQATPGGPTIASAGAVADKVTIGNWYGIGTLTVGSSGTLAVTSDLINAMDGGTAGTINLNGGSITVGSSFHVARAGEGTLNMTGGTITMPNWWFTIGYLDGSIAHVQLDGGTINADGPFEMRRNNGSVGTMDIKAGTLILAGDKVSTVQGYIDNGWITAYDGQGTLQLDYDVTNEGKTTLTAVHFLNPNPADGSLVPPGEVELSWTLPDPCVPGQPVPVDVYFTDDLQLLEQFTDPAAIQVVSKQDVNSVVVQTQPKTRYYWAVDTYIGDLNDPIFGPIFSFFADNIPPKVEAGSDVVTWLVDGVRTINLDATVTDDGAISPYTVQWTVVSEPNDPNSPDAVIAEPTAEDTSITLAALGEYVLQLEAFDGEYTGSDTVTINVYNDSCEAAQSLPDYVPLVGDLNGDCKVDIVDLELLLENWLKDNSLTEEWFNVN